MFVHTFKLYVYMTTNITSLLSQYDIKTREIVPCMSNNNNVKQTMKITLPCFSPPQQDNCNSPYTLSISTSNPIPTNSDKNEANTTYTNDYPHLQRMSQWKVYINRTVSNALVITKYQFALRVPIPVTVRAGLGVREAHHNTLLTGRLHCKSHHGHFPMQHRFFELHHQFFWLRHQCSSWEHPPLLNDEMKTPPVAGQVPDEVLHPPVRGNELSSIYGTRCLPWFWFV